MTIILKIVFNVLNIIQWAIIIDAILSFVPIENIDRVRNVLHIITEPFVYPFRALQEKIYPGFMIDFSPIGALLLIGMLQKMIFFLI